ncbi:MAG: hypothetical protein Q8P50_08565 [Bacillota bacterium]|nr:hypothetical protein [Bacillota bacterium]
MTHPVLIRRERRLPLPGEVLVSPGALVKAQDVIARSELVPGNPYIVDIVRELGIPNDQVRGAMLAEEGSRVKTGDVIARSHVRNEVREVKAQADGVIEFISEAYGRVLIREEVKPDQPVVTIDVAGKLHIPPWQIRWYVRVKEEDEVKMGTKLASESAGAYAGLVYSPVRGIVEKICGRTGTITIRRPYRPTLVSAYIPGKITETIPQFGAVVLGAGHEFEGVFGIGGEEVGRARIACGPESVLQPEDVRDDDSGAVLMAGASATAEAIRKAIAVGARALICGGVDIETLETLGVGVRGFTGGETLGLTLIAMHGFGAMPLSATLHEALEGFDGEVSVTGSTQMRTGVRRPEVLICSNAWLNAASAEARRIPENLVAGATVRVLMGNHRGWSGKVVSVEERPHRLVTEEMTEVAMVELAPGRIVEVPAPNLKVIA